MKCSSSCEELAAVFANALAQGDIASLAEILSGVESCSTTEAVRGYMDGLTEGQDVLNVFWEVLPQSGESGDESSYVHVCFDLGQESQLIVLTCVRNRYLVEVQDVEWGYPD